MKKNHEEKKQNGLLEDQKRWLGQLSQIDEAFVDEADPVRISKNPRRLKTAVAAAACLCLLLTGGGLYLFLPLKPKTPDLSAHKESEYYELIEKMSSLYMTSDVTYKNNFDKLTSNIGSFFPTKEDAMPEGVVDTGLRGESFGGVSDGADGDSSTGTGDVYEEVTDNQVSGVTESDRFKRTKDHLFYLHNRKLTVYSIAGEDSREVGSYSINDEEFRYTYDASWEFYLSADGKTVTLIAPYASNSKTSSGTSCVAVIALDVSDPTAIATKSTVRVTGGYLSSRMTDGKLLLVSRYTPSRADVDFDDAMTFVPQIDCGKGAECIPADDIVSPNKLTSASYTVLTMLDDESLAVIDTAALLSYSSEMYVSAEHMFITRSFTETAGKDNTMKHQKTMSEIYRMAYGDGGFFALGSVVVEGSILNQYSMDEFEGVLRVVTTSEERTYRERNVGYTSSMMAEVSTNANLYCFTLADNSLVASVLAFAPDGERVQSVRFDGTSAYVCTSVQLSDPVFFFDLSDLSNITYKDTGTIEGFSTSLVNFADGYLLGIGRGDSWSTVKIEIYEESVDGVVSVCSYEIERASICDYYKAYYIDREESLIGMGVALYDESPARYLVLYFDGSELVELLFTDRKSVV